MSDHEREENQETVGTPTATLDIAPELSIVMPCLNEAETLGTCIQKAQAFLHRYQVTGEIVVADNGSTDGSQEIATLMGARVVHVEAKGYGNALMGGDYGSARSLRYHGRCRRQLRLSRSQPFRRQAARRAGSCDGVPVAVGRRYD